MDKLHTIVVLADGDTWSSATGASLCIITQAQYEMLVNGEIDPKGLTPVKEIAL